jgi:large subunit ribosomal protein L10
MTTPNKEKKVAEFIKSLEKARITFVAEYHGLTVEEASRLRRTLHDSGAEMKIMKNTLAKIAVKQVGYDVLINELKGPLAFFLGYDESFLAPKIVSQFTKTSDKIKVKSGYFAGKLLSEAGVKELSDLPPMQELRARFAGVLIAPQRQILTTIQSPLNQLVLTLDALVTKQQQAAS